MPLIFLLDATQLNQGWFFVCKYHNESLTYVQLIFTKEMHQHKNKINAIYILTQHGLSKLHLSSNRLDDF